MKIYLSIIWIILIIGTFQFHIIPILNYVKLKKKLLNMINIWFENNNKILIIIKKYIFLFNILIFHFNFILHY